MKDIFLSIVIPCYNGGKYLRRSLNSIVNIKYVPLEVIIVDDVSSEPYDDVIDEFRDKLNIRFYQNEYRCGSPANGRELGAQLAKGEYLTFMDCDDVLIYSAIQQLKSFIIRNGFPEYIVSGIRGIKSDGKTTTYEKYESLTYLHGKFFNVDKFYRKCDLHFKKDMYFIEDQYLCALINCNLAKYNIMPTFFNVCTYGFIANEGSLSSIVSDNEKHSDEAVYRRMKVYIDTNYDTLIKFYKAGDLPKEIAYEWLIRTVVQLYFEAQALGYRFDEIEGLKELFGDQIKDIKDMLNISNKDIIEYVYEDNYKVYYDEYKNILINDADDIELQGTLKSFLCEVAYSHDEYMSNDLSLLNRPIDLSIIVPCYNSKKCVGKLLESISRSKMKIGLEVILVDNCSTEPYKDIINKYHSQFKIIKFSTDKKYSNMANAKNIGINFATGRYITFIDHDDEFITEGLDVAIKNAIVDEPLYMVTGIERVSGDVHTKQLGSLLYTYGKFFDRVEFINKYNIRFNPNSKYLEDAYLTSLIACAMAENDIQPYITDYCTYVLNDNKDSLEYNLKDRLNEFIYNQHETVFKFYNDNKIDFLYAREFLVMDILNLYFESQDSYDKFDDIKDIIIKFIKEAKNLLDMNNEQIIDFCYECWTISAGKYTNLYKEQYINYVNYHAKEITIHIKFNDFINKYCAEGNNV